ncbi:MAG: hypothetical protein UGF45_10740, partial [Massilioclostridium sp.]|nr:hypothetical protein [Massilioclostridium sp.]
PEEWKGATITGIDDNIISSTASFGYNGVYFQDVPEDSEAYALGFRERDIVKYVNGVELGNKATFHTNFNKIKAGALAIMQIHRTNKMQTLSFIAPQAASDVIDCNDAAVRYSTEVTTNLYAQDEWYYDVRPMGDQNNSICAYPDKKGTNDAWFEVDFSGTQIEFITRKYSDQGDIKMTIVNRDSGETVDTKTISCYSGQREYQKTVYTSPVLPQGNYTLRGEKTSGTYLIVDCFKVSGAPLDTTSLTVHPANLKYSDGVDAENLRDGETLSVSIPVANTGTVNIDASVAYVLYDTTNGLKLTEKSIGQQALPAGQLTDVALSIPLPADTSRLALKLMLIDRVSGTPIAYSTTLLGSSAYLPEPSINTATPDGTISVSYDKDTRTVSMTAAGLAENTQVSIAALSGETLVAADQVQANGTRAGYEFVLPDDFTTGTLTLKAKSELKQEPVILEIEIDPDKNLVNKDELNATIARAEAIERSD